jgi:hypothetical protein
MLARYPLQKLANKFKNSKQPHQESTEKYENQLGENIDQDWKNYKQQKRPVNKSV